MDKLYFKTRKEEVLKKVEDMRLRKIESLKKQIVKLEKIKF